MTTGNMSTAIKKPLSGYRLAIAATLVAIIVVTLGAFTRLVDAGLGCPDWPGCYGHLVWPDTAEEIAKAEAAFPDAPVDNDKTWPEMVHRYFASSLGLLIIILLVISIREQKQPSTENYPLKLPVFLLFLVVWQGLFGMWTVTLKLWPQVVTAHLLGGFTVLSLLWVLCLRLQNRPWQMHPSQLNKLDRFMPWMVAGLVLLLVQISLGGWTSSNYAALACPDLPGCQGQWAPPMDFGSGFNFMQDIGPNYLGGLMDNDARVAIHMSHRIGALIVSAFIILLSIRLWRSKINQLRTFALILAAALLLQVSLGVSNILFYLPLPVAVAHNAGGALLLLILVTLALKIKTTVADQSAAATGEVA